MILPLPAHSQEDEWPPYLKPEAPSPGELLGLAVMNYERGGFEISSRISSEIRRLDPSFPSKNGEFRRLQALIALQQNRVRPFFAAMQRDPALKDDPYLNFVAGIVAYRAKRLDEAAARFRTVASSRSKTDATETGLFPFHCAESRPRADIPLRQSISPLDRAMASFMIQSIEGRRDSQSLSAHGDDLSAFTNRFPLLVNLLNNPQSDAAHLQCIASFRANGATQVPSTSSIRFNFPDITELHKNRVIFMREAAALSDYGDALIGARRYPEALHSFRLALFETGWESFVMDGRLLPPIRKILIGLERSYEGLRLASDAMTMRRFQKGLPPEGGDGITMAGETGRRGMLDLCTENLKNREALLMLLAESKRNPRRGEADYKKMIYERDEARDPIEMRSAFVERFPY